RATLYAELSGGRYVLAGHIGTLDDTDDDWVAVAERLLHTPYLWGGASAFGLDCSSLVQLSMRMAGLDAPRDSDMQAFGLGEPVDGTDPQRGDLVFWKGHVGIMLGREILLHANGHTNLVSAEPLAQAVRRIAYLYGKPTGYRRLTSSEEAPNAE
ncbi:C40 family peptidase, partial [Rhizobiaceae bacterium]|nr:C40 family peptidase [Rhizobiaceae bacterium]